MPNHMIRRSLHIVFKITEIPTFDAGLIIRECDESIQIRLEVSWAKKVVHKILIFLEVLKLTKTDANLDLGVKVMLSF